ncbi:MAG: hypothetical protein PHG36_03645 [Dehalococcoidia bacterium]|nr:hypothetical protein [Dehalococcoidia bacterium]
MIIIVTLIVIAGVGTYFYRKSNALGLDKKTFCPESGATSVTALLIDATDSLSIQQKKAFSDEFQILRDSIPLHGRLDLYFIHSTQSSLLQPIVSLCNPGHGDEINPLVGNPPHVERTWQKGFGQPLEREISQLLDASPENKSPILESIQSVVLTSLSEPTVRNKPKKLIVVSDLMQHTSNLSLYRGTVNAEALIKNRSFDRIKSDLRDIDISVWMLARENALGRAKLADFWQRVFAEQGSPQVNFCVLVESNRCQNDK